MENLLGIIQLGNRYNLKNYLKQSDDNPDKWYLIFNNDKDYDYCRVGLKEGESDWSCNDFAYIDPAGGPFISIGSEFDNMKVYKLSSETINNKTVYTIYLK